ncbi:MAG: YraN family protein [Bacteroidales bacterium]
MAQHNDLGKEGEQKAINYLISNGYIIRHYNWKSGRYELDIVARKDDELIIIEVKTRRNKDYAHPTDAINDQKIRNIVAATDCYIRTFNIPFSVRFDIISVIHDGISTEIEHIEDAFYPPRWY